MRREFWAAALCLVVAGVLILFLPGNEPQPKPAPLNSKPYSSTIGDGTKSEDSGTVQQAQPQTPPSLQTDDTSNPDQSSASSTPATSQPNSTYTPSSGPSTSTPTQAYVQGDSLSVDLGPSLRKLLPDWKIELSAASGRHTLLGLDLMSRTKLPPVVVFALGTNDYESPASWQRTQLQKVLSLAGPERCVVLPTIWGDGAARPSINDQIYSLAAAYGPKRVQVMPWAEAVKSGAVHLVDGTHPANWKLRSQMMANAMQKCSGALAN